MWMAQKFNSSRGNLDNFKNGEIAIYNKQLHTEIKMSLMSKTHILVLALR